jgi:5-dehydro-4-deoxyglucarate dehydratase
LANIAPKLSLKIHELASQNDLVPLNELMAKYVVPHYAVRARRKGYEVSVVKAQMDILGLAGGPVRPPLVNVTDAEMSELKTMVESWKSIL